MTCSMKNWFGLKIGRFIIRGTLFSSLFAVFNFLTINNIYIDIDLNGCEKLDLFRSVLLNIDKWKEMISFVPSQTKCYHNQLE